MADTETYAAAPAQIGNSRGYRVDAALFQAHPEMREGTFEATYLGAGTLLVRQRPAPPERAEATPMGAEADPVIGAYLAWTERAMQAEPGLLRPLTAREFALAEALVDGVEVDLERDRLPEDFELP